MSTARTVRLFMVAGESSCYLGKRAGAVCPGHLYLHGSSAHGSPRELGLLLKTDTTVSLPVVEFGCRHEGERGGTRATHMTEYCVIALSRAKF